MCKIEDADFWLDATERAGNIAQQQMDLVYRENMALNMILITRWVIIYIMNVMLKAIILYTCLRKH